MDTLKQVRLEFYNALNNDTELNTIISNRIYWINKITTGNNFPLITYFYFDSPSEYAFNPTGVTRVADEITFQVDIYVSPEEIDQMDDIYERLKVVLNALGYRNINSPTTFIDDDIVKNIRPTRWERYNV